MADRQPPGGPVGTADRRRGGRRPAILVVAGVAVLLLVAAAVAVVRWPGDEEVAVEHDAPVAEEPPVTEEPPGAEEPPVAEGPPAPEGGDAPEAEPDRPAEGGEPTPPVTEPVPDVVAEDRDGATFAMSPGDTTALRLSNDWLWEEPQVSGASVALATVDHLVDPGYAEWEVEAVAAGTAEVAVAGSPNCGDEAACPPRTVTITFAVAGA